MCFCVYFCVMVCVFVMTKLAWKRTVRANLWYESLTVVHSVMKYRSAVSRNSELYFSSPNILHSSFWFFHQISRQTYCTVALVMRRQLYYVQDWDVNVCCVCINVSDIVWVISAGICCEVVGQYFQHVAPVKLDIYHHRVRLFSLVKFYYCNTAALINWIY